LFITRKHRHHSSVHRHHPYQQHTLFQGGRVNPRPFQQQPLHPQQQQPQQQQRQSSFHPVMEVVPYSFNKNKQRVILPQMKQLQLAVPVPQFREENEEEDKENSRRNNNVANNRSFNPSSMVTIPVA
jgi:hypothetical protein